MFPFPNKKFLFCHRYEESSKSVNHITTPHSLYPSCLEFLGEIAFIRALFFEVDFFDWLIHIYKPTVKTSEHREKRANQTVKKETTTMESGFVITVTLIKPLLHKTQNTDLSKLVLYRTSSGQSVVVDERLTTSFPLRMHSVST